ncbi:MAG TPA: hypothetical protein VE174_12515 [Actinomycetota bacterium]|nr:hypothetical protein [Actinomycetota bacterium]
MKRARTTLIAAFAGGGVLVAHWLGFLAASHSHDHHQGHLMQATGHDLFTYVVALAAAISAFLLSRYTRRRMDERHSPEISGLRLFAQAGVRMIPLQVIAFLLLESIERVVFAGGFTNILAEPAVQFGLAFQIVVALVGALLLATFAGAVEAVRRRTRFAARRGVLRIYPKTSVHGLRRLVLADGGTGLRGPPALSK